MTTRTWPAWYRHHTQATAAHAMMTWGIGTCADCGRWSPLPAGRAHPDHQERLLSRLTMCRCTGTDCEYMNGSIKLLPPMPGKEKDA